jgi:hypothetical protein
MKAPKSALKRSTAVLSAATAVALAGRVTRLRWNDCEGGYLHRIKDITPDPREKQPDPEEVNRSMNKEDDGEEYS